MELNLQRQTITITAKNEKDAVRIQDELANCGFGAIFGYTPDIQQYFNNNLEGFTAEARRGVTPPPVAAQPADAQADTAGQPDAAAPPSPGPAPANRHEDGGSVNINDYKGPEF